MSDSPLRDWLTRVVDRAKGTQPLDVLNADWEPSARPPGNPTFLESDFHASSPRVAATLENDLTITVFSSLTLTIELSGFVKRPDGSTQPIGPNGAGYLIGVIGDRTPRAVSLPRGSGVDVLGLSVVVVQSAGTVPIGAVWAICQQSRTLPDGSRVITSTLFAGPVSNTQALGWPGSPVAASVNFSFPQRYAINGPAVGTDWTTTVPLGARWEVLSLFANFFTSATVANRNPILQAVDQSFGVTIFFAPLNSAIVANTNASISWVQGAPLNFSAPFSVWQSPLPFGLILAATNKIDAVTGSLQAGDQWLNLMLTVRESLDP